MSSLLHSLFRSFDIHLYVCPALLIARQTERACAGYSIAGWLQYEVIAASAVSVVSITCLLASFFLARRMVLDKEVGSDCSGHLDDLD